ncbi:hypothetical protein M9458_015253, partial [Cirrhinus mrigala]
SARGMHVVSSRTAGIPKPTHFHPPVFELFPLSVALSTMGIAIRCLWAAYITTKFPDPTAFKEGLPEVVVEAAEPLEMAVPTPDPPEYALVTVVASTHELTSCPKPTAEAMCEMPVGPVTAMEAVPVIPVSPEPAIEAVRELSVCSELSVLPVIVKESKPELAVSLSVLMLLLSLN